MMITTAVSRQIPPACGQHWVYCGGDFITLHHLESVFGGDRRLSLADELDAVTRALRSEFVDWLGQCGRDARFSTAWEMSSLGGHSVTTSAFFVSVCYLEALHRVIARRGLDAELLVVCDDWFMLRAVEANARAWGAVCRRGPGWRKQLTSDAIRSSVRWGGHWIAGLRRIAKSISDARATAVNVAPAPSGGRGHVLINTCVDESCFGQDGTFRDRYYPQLEAWLQSQSWRVTVIPWLFNIKRTTREAFAWARGSKTHMLVLEEHMRWRDIPTAMIPILGAACGRRNPAFGGLKVAALWQREKLHDSAMAGRVKFLLYGRGLVRWLNQGNKCDVYIDFFENMPSERPLVRAFQRHSPQTLTVGYRHMGGIAADALNYFISEPELRAGYLPRRIVVNSHQAMRALVDQGFPVDLLRLGPALRYEYLLRPLSSRSATAPQPQYVLALLPLDLSGALEILANLWALREEFEFLRSGVVLKAHPMCPQARLQAAFGRQDWPTNWKWVGAPVQELLSAAIVVVGYESVLLEAAASAVPFASLRRETGLTLNPLASWTASFPGCRNLSRREFLEMLKTQALAQNTEAWRVDLARAIRADLGPLDDECFSAFVTREANPSLALTSPPVTPRTIAGCA